MTKCIVLKLIYDTKKKEKKHLFLTISVLRNMKYQNTWVIMRAEK